MSIGNAGLSNRYTSIIHNSNVSVELLSSLTNSSVSDSSISSGVRGINSPMFVLIAVLVGN